MKLIAETPTKVFQAIEVPMDAKDFEIKKGKYVSILCCSFKGKERYEALVVDLKNPEIIGIQGGGESLTEEQAREIVPYSFEPEYSEDGIGKFHYHLPDKSKWFSNALECYKEILKTLGFQTENPDGKLWHHSRYKSLWKKNPHLALSYPEYKKQWEQAERSLVKVVIIESDK